MLFGCMDKSSRAEALDEMKKEKIIDRRRKTLTKMKLGRRAGRRIFHRCNVQPNRKKNILKIKVERKMSGGDTPL